MTDISIARSAGLLALSSRWKEFSRWWFAELRETVPSRWLGWVQGEAMPCLMISRDRDILIYQLSSSAGVVETRLPLGRFGAIALEAWLAQSGLKRTEVRVGIVLKQDLFFLRKINVPAAAQSVLPRILDQELLRWTPFQLEGIWHAAVPAGKAAADILPMNHWIIRRDHAELALAELGFKADEVDFLAVVDHEGGPVPAISLTVEDPQDPVWAVRAIKGLAVIGLAVTIVGLLMFEWRQAAVAADVEAALEQARQEIQGGVRTNPAARVLALKADASVLEIWDEISRILPDHTFVTELRMADGKVTLSGLSSDAARLVRIIDQSSLFSSATLAAAIVPDATEGKERFSIGFKVLGARAGRSSTHRPDGTAS